MHKKCTDMNITPYRKRALKNGLLYETFVMESRLESEDRIHPTFKPLDMTKLVLLENEESENEEGIQRLVINVKSHMLEAMDRYLNLDLTAEERSTIEAEKLKVAAADGSEVLTAAIANVLDITFRFDRRYWLKRHD